jgi:hypothetical protein
MVFAPASDEMATALQFLIQGALQQWLGDLIIVEGVTAEVEESTLRVAVAYQVRRTQQHQVQVFEQAAPL